MAFPVNFYTGTYEEYKALNKTAFNALYFCTDLKLIFRDNEIIPIPYQVIENGVLPTENLIKDLLYLDDVNNIIYVYNGTNFVPIFGQHILSVERFNNAISMIAYDSNRRLITLPQIVDNSGLNPEVSSLTIDLGKDLIIDPEHTFYNSVTKKIMLAFRTMDNTDVDDITYVPIPVDDLIDIYTGDITDSIIVTVDEATDIGTVDPRKIKATIKIHQPIDGEKPNGAIIKSDGVYVDVESYADNKQQETYNYIGDFGEGPNAVKQAVNKAQQTADDITDYVGKVDTKYQTIADSIEDAKGVADAAVPKTYRVAGKSFDSDYNAEENNLILSYEDIENAAPIQSPNFTGVPTSPTVAQSIDWREEQNKDIIASIAYVQEAINKQNSWGSLKRRSTWAQLKGV